MNVYLAGPILGSSYKDVNDWREIAAARFEAFGITALSPMRYKQYLAGYDQMPDAAEQFPLSSQKGIVTRDRHDAMICDAMLVNLLGATRASIGTMIELGWADAFRKPIITILGANDFHQHAFVRELSGFMVPTLEDGLDITIKVLIP